MGISVANKAVHTGTGAQISLVWSGSGTNVTDVTDVTDVSDVSVVTEVKNVSDSRCRVKH